MKKFAIMIDWKASVKCALDLKLLEANTLIEAMNEAEKYFTDDIYLISILEKSGKVARKEGYRATPYTEILTNRGNGWHACDDDHFEDPHTWTHHEFVGFDDWFLER